VVSLTIVPYEKKWMPLTLSCVLCGKQFTQKAANQKYCSYDCQLSTWRDGEQLTRRCRACGQEFRTWRKYQRYCSSECGQRYRQKYRDATSVPLLKEYFVEKYDFRCQQCAGRFDFSHLHVHHIKPIALGGESCEENITVLCRTCHAKQHNNLMADYVSKHPKFAKHWNDGRRLLF